MKEKIIHEGHLTLVQREFRGKTFDVVVSKDAATMMYIDPEDHVYLVNQYRVPIQREILELPAETLDKPEKSPLEVIVEGLEEECGIKIHPSQVRYFGAIASSEGHDTEKVHLFYAYGPCTQTQQRLEDSEKIDVVRIPFEKAYKMIATGEIQGSKSTILLQSEYIRRLERKLKDRGI